MPPPLLFDLGRIDLGTDLLTREQVYERLPHRFEFMLLGGVCYLDSDAQRLVAYADVTRDAWWCRGHVPGRPLLPGVLMLEMAAQASAILAELCGGKHGFVGFGGVEACKFREAVVPPARIHFLVVGVENRPRRVKAVAQGVVEGRLIFEATTVGLTMP